jgi:hypothetical protein
MSKSRKSTEIVKNKNTPVKAKEYYTREYYVVTDIKNQKPEPRPATKVQAPGLIMHAAWPGPMYWDFKCLLCDGLVRNHANIIERLLWRLTKKS